MIVFNDRIYCFAKNLLSYSCFTRLKVFSQFLDESDRSVSSKDSRCFKTKVELAILDYCLFSLEFAFSLISSDFHVFNVGMMSPLVVFR